MIKNKYFPLKNTDIDDETKEYLIRKIDLYKIKIEHILMDKIRLIEKVIKKGYKEDEAIKVLGINILEFDYYKLEEIKYNLLIGKGISEEDIIVINRAYSQLKPNFNIFSIITNILFKPIELIPKKRR